MFLNSFILSVWKSFFGKKNYFTKCYSKAYHKKLWRALENRYTYYFYSWSNKSFCWDGHIWCIVSLIVLLKPKYPTKLAKWGNTVKLSNSNHFVIDSHQDYQLFIFDYLGEIEMISKTFSLFKVGNTYSSFHIQKYFHFFLSLKWCISKSCILHSCLHFSILYWYRNYRRGPSQS